MMRLHRVSIFFFLVLLLQACASKKPINYAFPDPVDTETQEIDYQAKRVYQTAYGVSADNEFNGARLNGFEAIDEGTFKATISPENAPINPSAYYSFRIWAEEEKEIELQLHYTEHNHRYWPKLSRDRETWLRVDTAAWDTLIAGNVARLKLKLGPEKLFVSGQELYSSEDVASWCEELAMHANVDYSVVGKSKLGRDMLFIDICEGAPLKKDAILIIGRQHPPEVSGHFAMNAFVEEIMSDTHLSNAFRKKFRIMLYPLMNPDGVDLGHWRHSAGGVDLNRDWQFFHQEEIETVTKHIVAKTSRDKNKVLFGIDFHSTYRDLYYTLPDDYEPMVSGLKNLWLQGIDENFPEYTPDDRPGPVNRPVSMGWFYAQFGAESITYEIGDETPRDFVRAKGKAAARELMQLLVLR